MSREKHGATESPSLQIHILPPGSSHSSYQSYGGKTEANVAIKKSQSPLDPSSCVGAGLCGACSGFKTLLF